MGICFAPAIVVFHRVCSNHNSNNKSSKKWRKQKQTCSEFVWEIEVMYENMPAKMQCIGKPVTTCGACVVYTTIDMYRIHNK